MGLSCKSALGMFVVLTMLALSSGCGSSTHINTAGRDGDGSGPKPGPDEPVVTSLIPATAVAGGPGFTLTVIGRNFPSNSFVVWDNTSLDTTYISSTELKARVPANLIASPGSPSVTDHTPSTDSPFYFGAAFTIQTPKLSGNNAYTVTKVPIPANDMVWDPKSKMIYLSVPDAANKGGDTITALNPFTGQLGLSASVGSDPNRLAISSDDSYLYAGINGNHTVERFLLPDLTPDISIPLGSTTVAFRQYPNDALDIVAAPGEPNTIAVLRSEEAGVAIYDDSTARPTTTAGAGVNEASMGSIQWNPDGKSIYAIDTPGDINDFFVLSVDSNGVKVAEDYPSTGCGAEPHYAAATGYVYCDYGAVIDPSNGTIVGSFPINDIQGGFIYNGVMIPDSTLNIAYFLGNTNWGHEYAVEAFDLKNFKLLGAIPIPNVVGFPVKLIRWGPDGLALLTNNGPENTGTGVYLIAGSFVTSPAVQN